MPVTPVEGQKDIHMTGGRNKRLRERPAFVSHIPESAAAAHAAAKVYCVPPLSLKRRRRKYGAPCSPPYFPTPHLLRRGVFAPKQREGKKKRREEGRLIFETLGERRRRRSGGEKKRRRRRIEGGGIFPPSTFIILVGKSST